MKPDRDDTPVLITDAAWPHEEDLVARKRKYLTTMGVRMGCLVVAGLVYSSWWLAVGFVLLSIPLPWIAVLVANDRSPRTVEGRGHPVVDERP